MAGLWTVVSAPRAGAEALGQEMTDALPDAGPFRIYPTRSNEQRFARDADACSRCLGGTCCQSEDAIYLTSLDVLRLATFLDLSPGEFMKRFTQESFAE